MKESLTGPISDDYFPIVRLHRDDLEAIGFDAREVSDETMRTLSADLCDCYCDQDFWNDLRYVAEKYGIPEPH